MSPSIIQMPSVEPTDLVPGQKYYALNLQIGTVTEAVYHGYDAGRGAVIIQTQCGTYFAEVVRRNDAMFEFDPNNTVD